MELSHISSWDLYWSQSKVAGLRIMSFQSLNVSLLFNVGVAPPNSGTLLWWLKFTHVTRLSVGIKLSSNGRDWQKCGTLNFSASFPPIWCVYYIRLAPFSRQYDEPALDYSKLTLLCCTRPHRAQFKTCTERCRTNNLVSFSLHLNCRYFDGGKAC